MTPGERKQARYRRQRKAWAEAIGRPYPERPDEVEPDPGTLDIEDEELG